MKKYLVGYNRRRTPQKIYIPVCDGRVLRGGPFKRARDAEDYVERVKSRYIRWHKSSHSIRQT